MGEELTGLKWAEYKLTLTKDLIKKCIREESELNAKRKNEFYEGRIHALKFALSLLEQDFPGIEAP